MVASSCVPCFASTHCYATIAHDKRLAADRGVFAYSLPRRIYIKTEQERVALPAWSSMGRASDGSDGIDESHPVKLAWARTNSAAESAECLKPSCRTPVKR